MYMCVYIIYIISVLLSKDGVYMFVLHLFVVVIISPFGEILQGGWGVIVGGCCVFVGVYAYSYVCRV